MLKLLFCVPNVVYLYEFEMSIVKNFSVDLIHSEPKDKEKFEL